MSHATVFLASESPFQDLKTSIFGFKLENPYRFPAHGYNAFERFGYAFPQIGNTELANG